MNRRQFIVTISCSMPMMSNAHGQNYHSTKGLDMSGIIDEAIERIAPTYYDGHPYYPAAIRSINGDLFDPAYLIDKKLYEDHWGCSQLTHDIIGVDQAATIEESSYRIHSDIAQKISLLEESGMGYKLLIFLMNNGERLLGICGFVSDFFSFPNGYSVNQVVDVELSLPTTEVAVVRSVPPSWCLI